MQRPDDGSETGAYISKDNNWRRIWFPGGEGDPDETAIVLRRVAAVGHVEERLHIIRGEQKQNTFSFWIIFDGGTKQSLSYQTMEAARRDRMYLLAALELRGD